MEAFFCGVEFPGAAGTSVGADEIFISTISSPQIDLSQRDENPSSWYKDQRTSPSYWQSDKHNEIGYKSTF